MSKAINIADTITAPDPCLVQAPIWDWQVHGWTANNSIIATECVPVYRAIGGGTTKCDLVDFETAVKQSLLNLNTRIEEINKLKTELWRLL